MCVDDIAMQSFPPLHVNKTGLGGNWMRLVPRQLGPECFLNVDRRVSQAEEGHHFSFFKSFMGEMETFFSVVCNPFIILYSNRLCKHTIQ